MKRLFSFLLIVVMFLSLSAFAETKKYYNLKYYTQLIQHNTNYDLCISSFKGYYVNDGIVLGYIDFPISNKYTSYVSRLYFVSVEDESMTSVSAPIYCTDSSIIQLGCYYDNSGYIGFDCPMFGVGDHIQFDGCFNPAYSAATYIYFKITDCRIIE